MRLGDHFGPHPPVKDERRQHHPHDQQGGADPHDDHTRVPGDLQAGELLRQVAGQLELVLGPLDLEQVRIIIEDPRRRELPIIFRDGQLDSRVLVLDRLRIDAAVLGIEPEVRHKIRQLELEPQIFQFGLLAPVQDSLAGDLVRGLVPHHDPRLLDAVPGIAVAGLIEPDALIDQWVVDGDRLGDPLLPVLDHRQGAVVGLNRAVVVVVDPELVHVQVKVPLRDVIGLPFEADAEVAEAQDVADEPARHDDRHAEVGHVGSDPAQDAFRRVEGRLGSGLVDQYPIAPFRERQPQRLGDLGPFGRQIHRRGSLQVLDERRRDVDLVLPDRAPDRREPLVETGQGVDAE